MEPADIVKYISVTAVVLLLAVIFAISIFVEKDKSVRSGTYMAIAVALSFVLHLFSVQVVPFGGSITPASLVPILIYAFIFGFAKGLLAGLIFGFLNFLSAPWFLLPAQFILDYLLAFAAVALAAAFKKTKLKKTTAVMLGATLFGIVRFLMHFFAGLIIFAEGSWVTDSLPVSNAFIYSFVYQMTYVPLDTIIAIAVIFFLLKAKVYDRLEMMAFNKKGIQTDSPGETDKT